jgi:hypothetical protein
LIPATVAGALILVQKINRVQQIKKPGTRPGSVTGAAGLQGSAIGEGRANLAIAVQEIKEINKRAPGVGAIVALRFILAGPIARRVALAIGVRVCSPKCIADLGLASHKIKPPRPASRPRAP